MLDGAECSGPPMDTRTPRALRARSILAVKSPTSVIEVGFGCRSGWLQILSGEKLRIRSKTTRTYDDGLRRRTMTDDGRRTFGSRRTLSLENPAILGLKRRASRPRGRVSAGHSAPAWRLHRCHWQLPAPTREGGRGLALGGEQGIELEPIVLIVF